MVKQFCPQASLVFSLIVAKIGQLRECNLEMYFANRRTFPLQIILIAFVHIGKKIDLKMESDIRLICWRGQLEY